MLFYSNKKDRAFSPGQFKLNILYDKHIGIVINNSASIKHLNKSNNVSIIFFSSFILLFLTALQVLRKVKLKCIVLSFFYSSICSK